MNTVLIDLTADSPPPAELEIQNAESILSDKSAIEEVAEAQLSFPLISPSQTPSKQSVSVQATLATMLQTQQVEGYVQSEAKSCQINAEKMDQILISITSSSETLNEESSLVLIDGFFIPGKCQSLLFLNQFLL